jgi:ubiquinone/menaquinone biosynthesis C-methylase UbiE
MVEPDTEYSEPHYVREYAEHTRRLLESWESPEGALQAAVGSATPEEYEMVGRMERLLLMYAGLRPGDSLVDVGCGSGRLAVQLADWLQGPYLGTDVVQSLLDQAARSCDRPDWRFERVYGLTVPAASESVDMACAFSVFTHLRHEESYVYMMDIHRVLKPGARFVFSFLDYRVPELWHVMDGNVQSIGREAVLNQFMSIDAVEVFAQHLGFELMEVHQGDERFIPLTDPSGRSESDTERRSFGQSVALYRKPPKRADRGTPPSGALP